MRCLMCLLALCLGVWCVVGPSVLGVNGQQPLEQAETNDDDGFVSIFDGSTLDGWHAIPKESASDWTVRDGVILGHGSANRLSYLVWKEQRLEDFELKLRYRLPGKGNTGIEIRSQPDPTGRRPLVGYHADLGHGGIGPRVLGAWDFHFAKRKEPSCPRGTRLVIDEQGNPRSSILPNAVTVRDIRSHQWNDLRILARGNHFQFYINDKLASEFTDNAKQGRLDRGTLGLQIHNKDMQVEFKDVRLKRLTRLLADSPTPPLAKQTRFLVLDSQMIEWTDNAKLTLGQAVKSNQNPLMAEEKPWEKRFDNLYANVIFDEEDKLYKCWYSPFIVDNSAKGMTLDQRQQTRYRPPRGREMAICYATSKDGIHWDKPELGLVEFEGSKRNNILWRGPHGAGVFKDLHDPDPARRYKMFFKYGRICVAFSADGIHWGDKIACPEADAAGDTHNNAFWAPTLGKYVGITRTRGKMGRQVARIESDDFLKWTQAKVVLEGRDKSHQTYAMPVFFHGGVYLGLVAIFSPKDDRVRSELAWSADTVEWNRVCPDTSLIENSEKEMAYDWGCVYAGAYPVFRENEIRLYYGGSDWHHGNWRNAFLCMATLRPDGFAGYEPIESDQKASITTRAIVFPGNSLHVSADVDQNGSIKVTVLDKQKRRLAESELIRTTVTDAKVRWTGGFSPSAFQGKEFRLRVELANAKLYSFAFTDEYQPAGGNSY